MRRSLWCCVAALTISVSSANPDRLAVDFIIANDDECATMPGQGYRVVHQGMCRDCQLPTGLCRRSTLTSARPSCVEVPADCRQSISKFYSISTLFANRAPPKPESKTPTSGELRRRSITVEKAEKIRKLNATAAATLYSETIDFKSDAQTIPRDAQLSQNRLDTGNGVELGINDVFDFIYAQNEIDPNICDYGNIEYDLGLVDFCGDFRCNFPDTMCRVNRFDESSSCWKITDSCLDALRDQFGTTVAPTTAQAESNTVGFGGPEERYDYAQTAMFIEEHRDECEIGDPNVFFPIPTRDCDIGVSCRLPQSICRYNLNFDTYSCHLLPRQCQTLVERQFSIQPTEAPTTTRTTSTTTVATTTSSSSSVDDAPRLEVNTAAPTEAATLPFANQPVTTAPPPTTTQPPVTESLEDVAIDRLKSRTSHHSLCCFWASRGQCSLNIDFMRQFCEGACTDDRCRGLDASLTDSSQLPSGFDV